MDDSISHEITKKIIFTYQYLPGIVRCLHRRLLESVRCLLKCDLTKTRNTTADSITDPAAVPSIIPASAPLVIPDDEEEISAKKLAV